MAKTRQLDPEAAESREVEAPLEDTPITLPPRTYIGPQPPPLISNLPCGCNHYANDMSRAEQDFLIETTPGAEAWYEEQSV